MTNFKLGKKQIYASSSSGFQTRKMEESAPLMNTKCLHTKQVEAQTKENLPHEKSSFMIPNSEIDGLLECPICSNAMFPPIQQVCYQDADILFH